MGKATKTVWWLLLFPLYNAATAQAYTADTSTTFCRFENVVNVTRLLLAEPSYGIRYHISEKYALQGEISGRPSLGNEILVTGQYSYYSQARSAVENPLGLNLLMGTLTNRFRLYENVNMDIALFYRYYFRQSVLYINYGYDLCTNGCYKQYEGDMNIRKGGVKFLLSAQLIPHIEAYLGGAIFSRVMTVEYTVLENEGENPILYASPQQFRKTFNFLSPHVGVNVVF